MDLRRTSGDLRQALQGFAKLGWHLTEYATIQDSLAVYDEGITFAQDHGLDDLDLRANRLDALDYAGRLGRSPRGGSRPEGSCGRSAATPMR